MITICFMEKTIMVIQSALQMRIQWAVVLYASSLRERQNCHFEWISLLIRLRQEVRPTECSWHNEMHNYAEQIFGFKSCYTSIFWFPFGQQKYSIFTYSSHFFPSVPVWLFPGTAVLIIPFIAPSLFLTLSCLFPHLLSLHLSFSLFQFPSLLAF